MQRQILPQETPSTYSPPVLPAESSTTLDVNTALVQETNPATFAALRSDFEEKNRYRKRHFGRKFRIIEYLSLANIAYIYIFTKYKPINVIAIIAVVIPPFIILCGCIIWRGAMSLHMRKPPNFNVSELTQSGGIRAIPALIHCCSSGLSQQAHQMVLRELTSLLPHLKASDANLLTIADRHWLNIWLNNELHGKLRKCKSDIDFVLAILQAYEQVGDAKALPYVERLASRRPRNERQRRLREAALNCLPLLQANTEAVDHTQTLLRAADKVIAAPDTLLRPAAHAHPAAPDELLRADPTASEIPLP